MVKFSWVCGVEDTPWQLKGSRLAGARASASDAPTGIEKGAPVGERLKSRDIKSLPH